jgi:uncharacterized protein (DUF362 family)
LAIAQAASYDRATVCKQVRQLLDGIGGLGGLVRNRPRVAIKVHLAGATSSEIVTGVLIAGKNPVATDAVATAVGLSISYNP